MNYLLILLIFVLLPSNVIHELLGVQIHYVYALGILCSFTWLALFRKLSIRSKVLFVSLLLLILSLLASIVSGSSSQFLMGVTLTSVLILSNNIWSITTDKKAINFLITINMLILIGAWIGFFYALYGGTAIFHIINPDQRPNYLYLTTFSNSVFLNYIRPSGLFDEPGALTMFTSLVVMINELNKGEVKISLILLSLCLITFSLMNIILLIIYLFLRFNYTKKLLIITTLSFTLFLLSTANEAFDNTLLNEFVFSRLKVEDGRLAGDNRSNQVEQFFSLVDMDTTLQGNNVNKVFDSNIDQSSNPFSIYYGYGLLIWLPYVFFELFLFYKAVFGSKDVRFPSIALALTLLQRPYIYNMYWGLAIMMVVVGIIIIDKNKQSITCYKRFLRKLIKSEFSTVLAK